MRNICVLIVLVVVAAASVSAQAAPKKAGSQSARRYVNLPKVVQAPFSDGVLVGNTLYIAGRLGLDPKTGKLPDDVEQEARSYAESALALVPYWHYVRDILLVQIQKAKTAASSPREQPPSTH